MTPLQQTRGRRGVPARPALAGGTLSAGNRSRLAMPGWKQASIGFVAGPGQAKDQQVAAVLPVRRGTAVLSSRRMTGVNCARGPWRAPTHPEPLPRSRACVVWFPAKSATGHGGIGHDFGRRGQIGGTHLAHQQHRDGKARRDRRARRSSRHIDAAAEQKHFTVTDRRLGSERSPACRHQTTTVLAARRSFRRDLTWRVAYPEPPGWVVKAETIRHSGLTAE